MRNGMKNPLPFAGACIVCTDMTWCGMLTFIYPGTNDQQVIKNNGWCGASNKQIFDVPVQIIVQIKFSIAAKSCYQFAGSRR